MKVLILDDNLLDLMVLEKYFEGTGCELFATTKAKEAIALIERHQIELLVSDFDMPEMNGLMVLKQGKTLNASLVAWCVTASVDHQTMALCVDAFDEVFTKPLQYGVFAQAVTGIAG
jgi:CheY-like chemotaxis protein